MEDLIQYVQVHYQEFIIKITSIPVGFKEDYIMHSSDFEEFILANGYKDSHIEDIFSYMKNLKPFPKAYILN